MLPCPFCHSSALKTMVRWAWVLYYYVKCLTCRAQGPEARTAKAAEQAWDKRG